MRTAIIWCLQRQDMPSVKGFVPTPAHLVDLMVDKLFHARPPNPSDRLLDPGCGTGAFIHGVIRWCDRHGVELPHILGIDSDPRLLSLAADGLRGVTKVELQNVDYLQGVDGEFDFIVGNPPYVPITGLSIDERTEYRRRYHAAVGRFDLYLLFFEQSLRLLARDGRLVFITPEKFLYTQTAQPVRHQLAERMVEEIHFVDESSFGDLVTYPVVTTVTNSVSASPTRIILRDQTARAARFNGSGSWLATLNGAETTQRPHVASDAFVRISCGVATGADEIFVVRNDRVGSSLRRFAHPTISGRSIAIGEPISTSQSILVPYTRSGALLSEDRLGALGDLLGEPATKARLLARTCARRKPWYAFHENPPMTEILRPKILCKDIGPRPWFVIDESGHIVPRHSVYYLVPAEPDRLHELCGYLNSGPATEWLAANCQRAANGFLRLQSHVLKRLPIPPEFVPPMLALA